MDIRTYCESLTRETVSEFSQFFYDGWGDEITECRADILFWVQNDNGGTVYDDYQELDESSDESYEIHETLASIIGWESDQEWMTDEMKLWRRSQRINWWWILCDEAVSVWLENKGVSYDDENDDDLTLLDKLSKFLHHFENGYGYPNNTIGHNLNRITDENLLMVHQLIH